ncbi:MAG: hypothetical protein JJLCMIEE_01738 [Acidimicrobiales bacterium]|nr:MAG: universal stress protein [Actinomycetota bacterium]MBV6508673.1 hypothetical protein [Acidimicrobiales bacterium]RIK08114.1 MAG: hypothetical protein DCC48_01645 [Acidobacteriota bacterium]
MTTYERPSDWEEPVFIPDVDASFERLMVPFDGSHSAEQALGYAVVLARVTGAEIVVVVAYDAPVTVRRRGALVVEDTRAGMRSEAEGLAAEAVAQLQTKGCQARGIVIEGDPVEGILQTADAEEADIILMGRRGLTAELRAVQRIVHAGLAYVTHGSIAEKVTRHATVPVLLVG